MILGTQECFQNHFRAVLHRPFPLWKTGSPWMETRMGTHQFTLKSFNTPLPKAYQVNHNT
jgi:hypothetical protein